MDFVMRIGPSIKHRYIKTTRSNVHVLCLCETQFLFSCWQNLPMHRTTRILCLVSFSKSVILLRLNNSDMWAHLVSNILRHTANDFSYATKLPFLLTNKICCVMFMLISLVEATVTFQYIVVIWIQNTWFRFFSGLTAPNSPLSYVKFDLYYLITEKGHLHIDGLVQERCNSSAAGVAPITRTFAPP